MAELSNIEMRFDPESLEALRALQGKLTDEKLRLAAIDLAMKGGRQAGSAMSDAGRIESYIRYGRQRNTEGYVSIGNECFMDGEGDVISFKGENFFRACAMYVLRDREGETWTCVKRAGHSPESGCEDWHGRKLGDSDAVR